ncbi:protein phosphatase 2C domain-containing protein [Bremerella cremea]|uniref:Protein phosphatase 2C domain-containing protein n=1 Tax=Bremerella cremea TaxID=1031537 RepID=A0A368KZE1_9BACT|nr:PP2C family serine/threonine-protein phosphatase [Bremerella cremea]RCS56092.1 protein phosphatase 2C domain-containing protein [Bremerella cremea]
MWKVVFDSVIGKSHVNSGLPCQDACRVVNLESELDRLLVACVADGAGSASHSDEGATLACDTFVKLMQEANLDLANSETDWGALVQSWISEIREKLDQRAVELGVPVRQLACTFLAAVIGNERALFLQIGDGAIVRNSADGYSTLFWPQSGEYANTTNFLTEANFSEQLEFKLLEERVDEVALFTDGLERLVLKFEDQSVHAPFLTPFFASLRQTENPDQFFEPLRDFLGSEAINERTDDDKTLILATRLE